MSSIRQWLESLELGDYASAFEAGDIDWALLPDLDHDLLKDLVEAKTLLDTLH